MSPVHQAGCLDVLRYECPEIVIVELGINDFSQGWPSDTGLNPTNLSRDYVEMCLRKLR